MSDRISRRRLLEMTAAGASALALSGTQVGRAVAAGLDPRGPQGLPDDPADSGIDHVVMVTMENRSFDHMLGWLDRAEGRQAGLTFTDRDGVEHATWHLDTFQGLGFHDPDHSYDGGRVEYDDGACDGWLRAGSNDVYAIGYYTREDLSFYGHAARYWSVCDHFFASIMGPTFPNRFYTHAGQTDRRDNRLLVNGQVTQLPTIWDRLADAGLTGRYYYSDAPFLALWGGKYGGISAPFTQFLTDCAAGTLPEVSYVDPKLVAADDVRNDDHPHADIRAGQHFLNTVYEAVSASPNWPSTVLVITYDEWGGFFDHVPPTTAPDSDPLNALRGFRLPAIVISPRARRHRIAKGTYDHTSVLRMIEWRWGLPSLSPRDAAANNLAEVLDFRRPPDLTAPRWTVPELGSYVKSPPSPKAPLSPAEGLAAATTPSAEWAEVLALAARHGFAV